MTDKGLTKNIEHIFDSLVTERYFNTSLNANGLPGIFKSAKMGIGDLYLRILVDRTPLSRELEFIARHFNELAESNGLHYKINQRDSNCFELNKRLVTNDTLLAYLIQKVDSGDSECVNISRWYGSENNLLPAYLKRLQN